VVQLGALATDLVSEVTMNKMAFDEFMKATNRKQRQLLALTYSSFSCGRVWMDLTDDQREDALVLVRLGLLVPSTDKLNNIVSVGITILGEDFVTSKHKTVYRCSPGRR
jgi:hypothetical protein